MSPTTVATIREAVRELDRTLALQQVRPLRDWFAESVAPTQLTTMLAAIFARSALLLTSVGIYGVLAYTVASRTKEIGVRMAMGATRRNVMGLVLREGMTWAVSGILLGLIGAFAAASVIATLLFDVPAHDPVTFATVGGVITLVALVASAIPALRRMNRSQSRREYADEPVYQCELMTALKSLPAEAHAMRERRLAG